jgi:hypothetical protein
VQNKETTCQSSENLHGVLQRPQKINHLLSTERLYSQLSDLAPKTPIREDAWAKLRPKSPHGELKINV